MSGDYNQYQRDENNPAYMFTMPDTGKLLVTPGEYTFVKPPPIVGYWVFPGSLPGYETKFSVVSRPNWFHRLTMRVLLGLAWEDEK